MNIIARLLYMRYYANKGKPIPAKVINELFNMLMLKNKYLKSEEQAKIFLATHIIHERLTKTKVLKESYDFEKKIILAIEKPNKIEAPPPSPHPSVQYTIKTKKGNRYFEYVHNLCSLINMSAERMMVIEKMKIGNEKYYKDMAASELFKFIENYSKSIGSAKYTRKNPYILKVVIGLVIDNISEKIKITNKKNPTNYDYTQALRGQLDKAIKGF